MGRKSGESGFVLLDQVLLGSRKSWDAVKVTNALVWSVGDDLSGNGGVKSGHLQVDTDVGVVDIDNIASSQVSKTFVITNGVGSWGESGKSGNGGGLGKEFTALSGKLSGRSGGLWSAGEGGNGAVKRKKEER